MVGDVAVQEFAPSFALAEGRVVTVEDSVKLEPGLTVTMLQGLALPRDMEKVPQDLQPSLVHASAYLVQVCLSPNLTCPFFIPEFETYFLHRLGKLCFRL